MEQKGGGSASPLCRASSLCEETETMSSVWELGRNIALRLREHSRAALQTLGLPGASCQVMCLATSTWT